jgi:GNAT superfamily N-acetyltransferase
MMKYRLSEEKDFRSIISLWQKNQKALYRPFYPEVEAKVKAGQYIVCTPSYDDEIVGFITFSNKNKIKEFRLEHLCVREDYRKRGIGRKLLTYATMYNNKHYKATCDYIKGFENNVFYEKLKTENLIKVIEERVLPSGLTKIKIQIRG